MVQNLQITSQIDELLPENLDFEIRKDETSDNLSKDKDSIGLCLSGGGYRAMLFHAGALWRLNDIGWLSKLNRISSVSGGSITSGVLAMNWGKLEFDSQQKSSNFREVVIEPIQKLASKTIDIWAILGGMLLPGGVGNRIKKYYKKYLFGKTTLQDLPDSPRFIFNATNLQSGVLWRFSKPYMRDYRVGEFQNPEILLSQVVAASTAFPPFLSPFKLKLDPQKFTAGSGLDLQKTPYTSEIILTDGGVYDNLGLEALKKQTIVLVSDAGGKFAEEPKIGFDWFRSLLRVLFTIDNQVRSLRVRKFLDDIKFEKVKGTYWGIRTNIENYKIPDALPYPFEKTKVLAETPTRLKSLNKNLQESLINWGYAVCDAAMRKYVDPKISKPDSFPLNIS